MTTLSVLGGRILLRIQGTRAYAHVGRAWLAVRRPALSFRLCLPFPLGGTPGFQEHISGEGLAAFRLDAHPRYFDRCTLELYWNHTCVAFVLLSRTPRADADDGGADPDDHPGVDADELNAYRCCSEHDGLGSRWRISGARIRGKFRGLGLEERMLDMLESILLRSGAWVDQVQCTCGAERAVQNAFVALAHQRFSCVGRASSTPEPGRTARWTPATAGRVETSLVLISPVPSSSLRDHPNEQRVPLTLELELTARCNNDCRQCCNNLPAEHPEAARRELSREDVKRIAEEAVSLGVLPCLLTGGEPLLRPDFSELYMDLAQKGLHLSVFTNACLVSERHVELWEAFPPQAVEVTFYGATETTYERVTRRPGSYAAFRQGLARLLESGLPVRLKATVLRSNVAELPAMAKFCREQTADALRFDPILHLRQDGDPIRNEEIRAERLSPEEIAGLDLLDGERAWEFADRCARTSSLPAAARDSAGLFRCGAGSTGFHVSHDGRFRLCSALSGPEHSVDLRQVSLAEAWRVFAPAQRALRPNPDDARGRCLLCPINPLCSGCVAHAYLEGGRLDFFPDYFCAVTRARVASFGSPVMVTNLLRRMPC